MRGNSAPGGYMANENIDKVLEAIELARSTGKLKKGANEVTKAIERGTAKLVAVANDVSPKEIVMHIPLLAKEKNVPCFEVPAKDQLGASAGLQLGTAAIAIVQEGEAKKLVEEIVKGK
jgi:large subunit ribosomal protein L7Ae